MIRITDRKFRWVPSWKTNILDTFRKTGWIPPSEFEEIQTDREGVTILVPKKNVK